MSNIGRYIRVPTLGISMIGRYVVKWIIKINFKLLTIDQLYEYEWITDQACSYLVVGQMFWIGLRCTALK